MRGPAISGDFVQNMAASPLLPASDGTCVSVGFAPCSVPAAHRGFVEVAKGFEARAVRCKDACDMLMLRTIQRLPVNRNERSLWAEASAEVVRPPAKHLLTP